MVGETKNNIGLVDVSYMVYQAVYGLCPTASHIDRNSNKRIRNEILNRLAQFEAGVNFATGSVKPENMVLCFDAKPLIRSTIFPNYKKNRKPHPEGHKALIDDSLDFLRNENHGYSKLYVYGLEADDLIWNMVAEFKENPQNYFVVFSKDSDMFAMYNLTGELEFRWTDGYLRNRTVNSPPEYTGLDIKDIESFIALSGGHNNLEKLVKPAKTREALIKNNVGIMLEQNPTLKEKYEFNLGLVKAIEIEVSHFIYK